MDLLIADDHTLFRDALVQYIRRAEPDYDVVVAKDCYEVQEKLSSGGVFDLVMLDYKMPGMKGLDGLQDIRKKYPNIAVVLMSGMAERETVQKAIEMGVAGYFPKTLSGKALLDAIKEVVNGNVYIPNETGSGQFMPSYYTDECDKECLASFKLTKREHEVLGYIMKGASNKEIARELGLQEVTVKLHVSGVCRKLGAKNRTHAAMIAQQTGEGASG